MIKNYIKIALKVLMRRKFFTFISLFGISFTLTVLIIATSVFESVFGTVAPEIHNERTLGAFVIWATDGRGTRTSSPGYEFLDRYVRTLPLIENASIFSVFEPVVTYREGKKIELFLKRTDGEFWEILRFQFLEGGPFTREDERNANFVCVINETIQESYFGGAEAVGKQIDINGQRFTVKGVVKNVPIFRFVPFADVWVPISTIPSKSYLKGLYGYFTGIVLAKSTEAIEEIKSEYRFRLKNIDPSLLDGMKTVNGGIESSYDSITRHVFNDGNMESAYPRTFTAILIGIMLLFMALPAMNLVNVNVSRIQERISEIGIRKSFGATTSSLIVQFITENIIITVIGGILGFGCSSLILDAISESGIIPNAVFAFNGNVFLYGFLITLVFALISGIYPAWRMSRIHPVYAIRGEYA